MICNLYQKWPLIFLTLAMANPQIPQQCPIIPQPKMFPVLPPPPPVVPMPPPPLFPMPPPQPMPMSLPMIMRVDISIPYDKQEKPTEEATTTVKPIKDNLAVAVPMPMPLPMPIPRPMPLPMPMPRPMPVQMPMPRSMPLQMPMPQPIPMPQPMPMPVPIPLPIPSPSPVLFAIPGMMSSVCEKNRRHPNCPPCPPCTCSPCTPSFFSYCSLCHQKCRCRTPEDVPLIPPPIAPKPLQGPAFPMPYPGYVPYVQNPVYVAFVPQMAPQWNEESSKSDSCEIFFEKIDKRRRRIRQRKKRNKYGVFRRNNRRFGVEPNDSAIAKPVLAFKTSDGRVKMRKPLNNIRPSILIDE